jgi:Carboxypeptidase regulatory-like domain
MSRTFLLSMAAALSCSLTASAQNGSSSVPLGSPGTVTLSRAEYDRLLDLAARRPSPIDLAPVGAVLNRAEIRVRVDGSSARATMRLDGEVLRPGIAKVVLVKGATLLEARLENRPLPVIAEGGAHVALVQGPGPFSATLETGSPLTFNPGRGSFVLPVPGAGSATATIDVPGDQTDVRLSAGLIQRRASAAGRTIIEATLTPGAPTEVSWSTHDSAPSTAAAREVRLLADVKSIVSIGDADVRLVSLVNATIVQGEPAQIAVAIPAGYEVASVSGSSLDRSDPGAGQVVLFVSDPAQRRHQFMISLERTTAGGSQKLQTSFPTVPSAQRETGEVAVEGLGTLEVTAPADTPGLRRIDVRELDPALTGASRQSLLAAYRYQRTTEEPPSLELDVRRFADAAVLSAVAERAVATTLVTSEGRALTEVVLWIRNRAQPFMKVALPAGASILSVEVAGSPAKPVEGKDGSRVPLLRPGFRPDGPYQVSYVYLHAGTPFLKQGDMQMTLPKMDVPINVVEWELFVPDQFRVDHFEGNAIDASLMAIPVVDNAAFFEYDRIGAAGGRAASGAPAPAAVVYGPLQPGQIVGTVVDASGAPLPGVNLTVEGSGHRTVAVTDVNGRYLVSNVASGKVTVAAQLPGFMTTRRNVQFDQRPQQVDLKLEVGSVSETVTVSAEAPAVFPVGTPWRNESANKAADAMPSENVQNLQRRASGVLPVRMDIPRAGTSHRFVKPLVIEEEPLVSFRYKRR